MAYPTQAASLPGEALMRMARGRRIHDDLPLPCDLPPDADEPAEMICPRCRGIVLEDAPQCPHCGDWITPVDPSDVGSGRWVYLAVVLLMLLV